VATMTQLGLVIRVALQLMLGRKGSDIRKYIIGVLNNATIF